MSRYYLLAEDGKTPVPCDDVIWWAQHHSPVHVGDDTKDGVRVSTVFLGIDHSFGGPVPVLWETLVFMPDGEDGERYTSHEAAVAGHARYVAKYHRGAR